MDKIWTWQPGDPSTGGPDMRGPLVIYGSGELYATDVPAEAQKTIQHYEEKLSELREEIAEMKRQDRIKELLEELKTLGHDPYDY